MCVCVSGSVPRAPAAALARRAAPAPAAPLRAQEPAPAQTVNA